jgi:hypothetical protein
LIKRRVSRFKKGRDVDYYVRAFALGESGRGSQGRIRPYLTGAAFVKYRIRIDKAIPNRK